MSVPSVLAARVLRIPIILFEPNVIPGKANRFLALWADRVCVGYKESLNHWRLPFGVKPKWTLFGVPVRKMFRSSHPEAIMDIKTQLSLKAGCPIILVMGGSQGAKDLNNAVIDLVSSYLDIHWIHLTGLAHETSMRRSYQSLNLNNISVLGFSKNMAALISLADLVISRAGASTLAEIKTLRKPACIVPLKNSADDHQRYNALACEREGWAMYVPSEDRLKEMFPLYAQENGIMEA